MTEQFLGNCSCLLLLIVWCYYYVSRFAWAEKKESLRWLPAKDKFIRLARLGCRLRKRMQNFHIHVGRVLACLARACILKILDS